MVRNSDKVAVHKTDFAQMLIEKWGAEIVFSSHNFTEFHVNPRQNGFKTYELMKGLPEDIDFKSWKKQASITVIALTYK